MAALLIGSQACAQAAPASAGAEPLSRGDIVVTAQRRKERLHDVPVTVNVVTGETIEKQGLATLRDVVEHSPQISYQQTGDTRTDTLSIRGISSVSNVAGVEPDAAIVIDGETLARTMEMNYDAVDIDRIEILEGPQGTLFGKNAIAGLLNVVTRGPKLGQTISGDIKLTLAEDNEYRLKASLNVPLGDKSALLINGFGEYQGGWVKNAHAGQPNAGQESGGGARIQYLYQPDSTFHILARAEYTQKEMGIIPYAFKNLSEDDVINASKALSGGTAMVNQFNALLAASGINLLTPGGVSTPIHNGTLSYLTNDRNWGSIRNYAGSIQVKKDLEHASLIYQGSVRYFHLFSNDNEWGISAPQLTDSTYGLNTLDYAGPTNETTTQHELRIESLGESKLNYVAGAFYYFNRNYHHENYRTCNDAVYGYYNGSGYPNPNPINPVSHFNCTGGYQGQYSINDFETVVNTHNEALFGNVEYKPVHGLSVFGGARMLWEQQNMSMQHGTDDNTAAHFYSSTDPYGLLKVYDHRNALTHRVGAKYDFGPVMVYATESTGWKGVSWDNYNLVARSIVEKPLQPERIQQWEAGMRGEILHKRIDWQLSAFDMHDSHFQARVIWYQPGAISNRVIDAGKTHQQGLEFGWNAHVVRGLKVGGGLTWLSSKFSNSVLLPQRDGSMISLNGYQLPNAPKFSYMAYADYTFKLPGSTMDNELRLEMRHRSSQTSTVNPDPLQVEDPYSILDGYYTITPPGSRLTATFYVKNILNHLYYNRPYEPAVLGWTFGQMASLPRDYTRYFGVNLAYHFD